MEMDAIMWELNMTLQVNILELQNHLNDELRLDENSISFFKISFVD
jgi:hypothetical protein